MKNKKAFIIWLILSLVIWQFCTSFSKVLTGPYIKADNDFFSIIQLTNTGAAFGLLDDNPYFLGLIGVFAIIFVLIYVYKKIDFKDKAKILLSAIFAAGILGNTAERFSLGYVQDFIQINIFDFPIFNLFDILISVSIFLFIIFYIKEDILCKKKQ